MLKREGMRGKGLLISSSLTLYLSVSLPETPKDLFLPSSSWSIPEFLLYPFSSFFHFGIWLFIPPGFHSLLNSFAVPFDVVVSSSWYSSSSFCRVLFLLSLFLCLLSTWSFTWFLLSFPFSFSVCLRVWHPVYSSWYLADFFFSDFVSISFPSGFMVSSICHDERPALMLSLALFFPNLILSGLVWPIEGMPYILRVVSYFLPQTMAIKSMRSIISRGLGIGEWQVYIGFLSSIGWTAAYIVAALIMFASDRRFWFGLLLKFIVIAFAIQYSLQTSFSI